MSDRKCYNFYSFGSNPLEDATDDIGPPGGVNVLGGQDISRWIEVEPVGHVACKLLWALRILLLELLLTQKPYFLKEPPLGTAFWRQILMFGIHNIEGPVFHLFLCRVTKLATLDMHTHL